MKRSLLSIIFILTFNLSIGQVQSNCTNNTNLIANAYANDINHLATQRLYDNQHPDTALIIIPQVHTDSILQAMLGVYNLGGQLEADSVFSLYCIHEYQSYLSQIILEIDTSFAWTQGWQNQQIGTTNAQANSLVNLHGFAFDNIHYYANGTFVVLETANQINLQAFCDSISLINGIVSAEVEEILGIGNQITYGYVNNTYNLSFALRYAPSGSTIWNRTWDFSINNNCQVTQSKSTNNPAYQTSIVNCNLWPLSTSDEFITDLKIYPNPTTNLITISTKDKGELILRDLAGKVIQKITVLYNTSVLDITNCTAGMYLLEFKNGHGSVVKKIWKE